MKRWEWFLGYSWQWPVILTVPNVAAAALTAAGGDVPWLSGVASFIIVACWTFTRRWVLRYDVHRGIVHPVWHRGGIPWDRAPAPPRRHICRAWTRSDPIERCRCGNRRVRPLPWPVTTKNTRTNPRKDDHG